MLTLSQNQLDRLGQVAFEEYLQRLVLHLRERFPGHAGYLTQEQLLRVARHGCERAEQHGFETERDLSLYTELTVMLGAGFDSDPQLEWAGEVLRDASLEDPRSRMDDLWEAALFYLDRVLGPKVVFPHLSYQVAREHRQAGKRTFTASDTGGLIACFRDIWPEKTRYVGTATLGALIEGSRDAAARYGIRDDLGQAEFAIHAFLFGHQFHADPLYPWTDDILRNGTASGTERASKLVSAFEAHLDPVLV